MDDMEYKDTQDAEEINRLKHQINSQKLEIDRYSSALNYINGLLESEICAVSGLSLEVKYMLQIVQIHVLAAKHGEQMPHTSSKSSFGFMESNNKPQGE